METLGQLCAIVDIFTVETASGLLTHLGLAKNSAGSAALHENMTA